MNTVESNTLLSLSDVSVAYGSKTIVRHVSLDLKKGDIGCLLGPSGCGKSTLLRAIAGFEPVSTGTLTLAGKVLSDKHSTVTPDQRKIGMVFQDVSLFPHLSIEKNIAFGIKSQPKKVIQERVTQLLALIDLSDYAKLYPHQISGGQQQRVALARALAPKPELILLDEPFSGLDAKLRDSLVPHVKSILKKEKVSAIMVSHDQAEAFAIADKVAVMSEGNIHQWDTAFNSYHFPASKFVASFVGESKFLLGKICCEYSVETALGRFVKKMPHHFKAGSEVELLVRIEDVTYSADSDYSGKVIKQDFHGSYYKYELQLNDGSTVYLSTNAKGLQQYQIGDQVPLTCDIENVVIFTR
ncbi:ABC transporter ATP-binding protein [Psychromonas arctica]|uniref:ABC transporter ATP-binding protein n=1 Tax=Psychromonas arctica TaxID=168275 RepID=A0ABU9HDE9_9GAMM